LKTGEKKRWEEGGADLSIKKMKEAMNVKGEQEREVWIETTRLTVIRRKRIGKPKSEPAKAENGNLESKFSSGEWGRWS